LIVSAEDEDTPLLNPLEEGPGATQENAESAEAREKATSIAEPSCGCRVGARRRGLESTFGALLAALVLLGRRRGRTAR
jgi:hypothetical protein